MKRLPPLPDSPGACDMCPGVVHRAAGHCRSQQSGVTLVELMVAMTLGLLVLAVVTTVFGASSANRSTLERSGRLAENASYALEVMSDEIRLAGYFGETSLVGVVWQDPNPCATTMTAQGWSRVPFNVPVPIAGYAAADAVPSCIISRKPGTPVIVLHYLNIEPTPWADVGGGYFVQTSKCPADAAAITYSNDKNAFTLRKLDCTTLADIRQIVSRAYYVSTCNECPGDSTPTLKRAELVGDRVTVMPVVEGVENLQIEYGFDTDLDGTADIYLPTLSGNAGAADNDWSNVVSAKLYMLMRTTQTEPGYVDSTKTFDLGAAGVTRAANDGYKRMLMTSSVRLNNTAGRREAP
jgi:type IV pilus assembly protein PilW